MQESPDTLLTRALENMNATWITLRCLEVAVAPEDRKAVEYVRGGLGQSWNELEALVAKLKAGES